MWLGRSIGGDRGGERRGLVRKERARMAEGGPWGREISCHSREVIHQCEAANAVSLEQPGLQ